MKHEDQARMRRACKLWVAAWWMLVLGLIVAILLLMRCS